MTQEDQSYPFSEPEPPSKWDPNGQVVGYDYRGKEVMYFLCPWCGCWCPAELGGADDHPEACDVCWAMLETVGP